MSTVRTVREPAMAALFTLISNAYPWGNDLTIARRLKLWSDVPPEQRPAVFQFEGARNPYTWPTRQLAKRVLKPVWFIYLDARDPNVIGSQQINAVLDAVEIAMRPDSIDGRLTLGGLCWHAQIAGEVLQDPGDLDGDGLIIVPIEVTIESAIV
jgi:hypothetical protein